MWTRIYAGVLAAAMLVVGFFTYYAWGWVQSIGRPADAIAGYEYASGMAWTMLCVCSIVLTFIACGVMWTKGRAWALWVTFGYFGLFVALSGFWLDGGYRQLLERSDGIDTKLWATPVIAVLLIVGAAVPVLALQYLITLLRQKFAASETPPTAVDLDVENESSRLM
ncbi:MAG: hypothetical protein JO314_06715 [Acidobacteria bacterium]|nr:hypothetical protein [Acidobacteriota bacterium]